MSSMMAGVATGGITTLATGSLSRGLMAGLGAYGGAGLGESFMTAGGGMSAANAATTAQQQLSGANLALGEAMPAQAAEQFTKDAVSRMAPSGAVSAGFNKAIASPTAALDFAKGNLGNLGFAAAPLLAMQPTTKMPEPKDTGYIRQMAYNINPDTGRPDPLYGKREMTPIKASEFGNKTFQGQRDLFYQQNPNPYDIGIGSLNRPPQQQPTPMNTGGIVALAEGGGWDYSKFDPAKYVGKGTVSTQAEVDAARAAQEADNARQRTVTAQRVAAPEQEAAVLNALKIGQGLNTNTGVDANAGTVANANAGTGLASLNANTNVLTNANANANTNTLTNQGAGLTAIPADASYTNRFFAERGLGFNPIDNAIDGFLATYKTQLAAMTPAQQEAVMRGALDKERMNEADVIKATGMTIAQLVQAKRNDGSIIVPGKLDEVPVGSLPGGVSGAGNTVVNANGTITTRPDFSLGMGDVRDMYTEGGGSLGYTSPVVITPAEHEAAYNKLTDDSLDAYNFLMGKGKNLTQRKAETRDRPVMARYDEAVLGKKAVPRAAKATTKKTGTDAGTFEAPQTYFDEKAYLAANPDVAEELRTGKSVTGRPVQFTSGYEHYLMFGKAGGRKFTGDYDSYKGAVDAEKARAVQQESGGDGPAPPGPDADSTSPANSDAGNTVAKNGGLMPRGYAMGGGLGSLGSYSDGGRLLKGPGDGVSDSIPATIGAKNQPARLADGEFVVPARIVSELGNGSTEAGAKKLYAMMDRVQRARGKTTGKNKVAANSRADKYLPA
jgi:hypothetical protein